MTVVGYKSPWINSDGLTVYWPSDAGTVTRAGEVDFDGQHLSWVEADLTTLATVASGNQKIVAETTFIPKGAFIEQVDIITTKACTGATATLDVGLVKFDRTTELDFNGLLAAITVATIATAGATTKTNVGGTYAGALLGTKLSDHGVLTMNANTADFTAGKVLVKVLWRMLLDADV